MSKNNLVPLLNIREEYGFEREVDPSVVLGGFLSRFWSDSNTKYKDNLTTFLINQSGDISNRIRMGDTNKEELVLTLMNFLKQTLWTNSRAFEEQLEKKEDSSSFVKRITYKPLNHNLLGNIRSGLQLGQTLFECVQNASNPKHFEQIKNRLQVLETTKEAEELIIEAVLPLEKHSLSKPTQKGKKKSPNKWASYKDLFKQCGDDLSALLYLDFDSLSKASILSSLERLINLYALFYYLRIICGKEENFSGDLPLITPVCSDEYDDEFKSFGDSCFQIYRQKAIQFWRGYLRGRVSDNAKELRCDNEDASVILDKFIKNPVVFNVPQSAIGKFVDTLEDTIPKNLDMISSAGLDSCDQFAEAYLSYNLKASRTLARLRILDWQGPGAGLAAPVRGRRKYFCLHLKLLETLVIIFVSRHRQDPLQLSLQNFILEMRKRYGIVLGPTEGLEQALKEQGLSVPSPYLLEKNLGHLISMLEHLNMLESLSDTAMFVKCPFPLEAK